MNIIWHKNKQQYIICILLPEEERYYLPSTDIYMSTAHPVTKNDWVRGLLMKIQGPVRKWASVKPDPEPRASDWKSGVFFQLLPVPATWSPYHNKQSEIKRTRQFLHVSQLHRKVGPHGQPENSVRKRVLKCRTWTVQVLNVSKARTVISDNKRILNSSACILKRPCAKSLPLCP